MPIQFQCPSCNAAIRVDEAAAGKKGKCPQCSRELLVPRPTPVTEQPPSTDFPSISVRESSPTRTRSSRRGRKSGSRFWSIVAPVGMFAVVVGTMVFLLWEQGPNLSGKLPGEFAVDFEIPTKLLTAEEIGIPEEEFQTLVESVRTNPPPIGLIPKRMRLVIDANESAIRLSLQKTDQTEVVRVSADADKNLRAWLLEHRRELERLQRLEAGKTLTEFAASLQRSYDEDLPFDTAGWADRSVTLFESGLGFVTEAVTNESRLRCVLESDAGELYFLMPPSTKAFTLEGRPEVSMGFDGQYEVRLSPPSSNATE